MTDDRTRIAELEAELARLGQVLELGRANREGHPAMCCGACAEAIAQAEKERDDWRTDARNYALRSGQAEERVRVLEEGQRRVRENWPHFEIPRPGGAGVQHLASVCLRCSIEALLSPPAEQEPKR